MTVVDPDPVLTRQFSVSVYDGHTWVLGGQYGRPIGYLEGEVPELGQEAAGILGMRASALRQGRLKRAQIQADRLSAVPGWQWWSP